MKPRRPLWGLRSNVVFLCALFAPLCGGSLAWAEAASAPLPGDFSAEEVVIPGEDDLLVIEAEDDDLLVIEEEDDAVPDVSVVESPVTGALGRLWEAWHVGIDSQADLRLQAVQPDDGMVRGTAGVDLETWLLPTTNLSFYANGLARGWLDADDDGGELLSFVDVYEAYGKVNLPTGAVQLGRLIVPFGKTAVSAFGDRVNLPDHRRGWEPFPETARARQPQWGVWTRGSIGPVSLDGVLLFPDDKTEGSLVASDQTGVRVGRYQSALGRSPARLGGFLALPRRERLMAPTPGLAAGTAGLRARRRLESIDFGASVVWAPDDVPHLALPSLASRFLGRELLRERGLPEESLPLSPCNGEPTEIDCLGGPGALSHISTGSAAADVSWSLGVLILRAEGIFQPRAAGLPGKTALLVTVDEGLISRQVSYGAAALSVESGLGEWVTGTLELIDALWWDVPGGANLFGVETVAATTEVSRMVHRPALAWRLSGRVLEERLAWRLVGEGGPLQQDLLTSLDVQYRLPLFDLLLGVRGTLFTGDAGSPGWLRQDATSVGVFLADGD